jgi:hypothetical protein
MAVHKPSTVWCFNRHLEKDGSYVRTINTKEVRVVLAREVPGFITSSGDSRHLVVDLTRAQARLLARRINEMLEATK